MVALADLAIQPEGGLVSLAEISARQDISLPYLEQLFVKLRRAGLVESVRGPGGGYRLTRTPAEIRISDVMGAVDETVSAMHTGAGAKGIVRALDYLIASNRASFGDDVPEIESGELDAKGKRVIVVGGGDTAMDCVRTAIRQGAKSVKCLYRRDRENMPGSQREVANAEEEGVVFQWLSAPKGFAGDPVNTVKVQQMRLGAPDATGRQSPEEIDGAVTDEPADLVIKALGFEPEDLPTLWKQTELEVTHWGTVKAEFTSGQTSMEAVFAVGDIVRGASLVVWAIRDGRDSAQAILQYLGAAQEIAAE